MLEEMLARHQTRLERIAELEKQLAEVTAERDTLKEWMWNSGVANLQDLLEAVEAVKSSNITAIYEWLGKRE